MTVLEYLKAQNALNLAYIAKHMWPNHKSAPTYLSAKLTGKHRQFSKKDAIKAKDILEEIGKTVAGLTIDDR